jgi:hypothetical protein
LFSDALKKILHASVCALWISISTATTTPNRSLSGAWPASQRTHTIISMKCKYSGIDWLIDFIDTALKGLFSDKNIYTYQLITIIVHQILNSYNKITQLLYTQTQHQILDNKINNSSI